MTSVTVYQRHNESFKQVLQRAKEELLHAIAPNRKRAFVVTFIQNSYNPQSGMSLYEGTVYHPCNIRHRHTISCPTVFLGRGRVFIYWRKAQGE